MLTMAWHPLLCQLTHCSMRINLRLVLLLLQLVALAAAQAPPSPVTEQILQKVAGSLQMYVDPLPQMPKIVGYSTQRGGAASVSLTIGMYQKTWVCMHASLAHS